MSILNYFKRNSNALPEPSGTLSNVIPSRAIAAANKEVSNLVHTAPNLAQPGSSQLKQRRRRTKKNNVYSPQLRAEMGEAALKFGATAASRRYSAKLNWYEYKRKHHARIKEGICFREESEET